MADKYANFRTLARHERVGIDYGIVARPAGRAVAVMTPHGGGIEPGTSELADAIAAGSETFYAFEGLKPSGNADLHITSTRFDEPLALWLVAQCQRVITLHGEHGGDGSPTVYAGGRDAPLRRRVTLALQAQGFTVERHPDPDLQGLEPTNLCNRGRSGRGVQLEIARPLRLQMFRSLSREGRKHPTAKFRSFVAALREVLAPPVP